MSTTLSEMSLIDGLLDPLMEVLTVDQAKLIAGFRADDATQARAAQLAEKANRGTLSDDEREEYTRFLVAYDFVSLLQLRALRLVKANS